MIKAQALLSFFIKSEGMIPIVIYNEQGLINEVQEEKPVLIIIDIGLPFKDGLSIIRDLKKIKKFAIIPILTITGYQDISFINLKFRSKESGIDYFMKKPINFDKIKSILDHLSKEKEGLVA